VPKKRSIFKIFQKFLGSGCATINPLNEKIKCNINI